MAAAGIKRGGEISLAAYQQKSNIRLGSVSGENSGGGGGRQHSGAISGAGHRSA